MTSPFKTIINEIENLLSNITELQYIDEDWGQLDYYSPNFPVKWPCVLIDVSDAQFENLGVDIQLNPKNRQTANLKISFTVADQRLGNTSFNAPLTQKEAGQWKAG